MPDDWPACVEELVWLRIQATSRAEHESVGLCGPPRPPVLIANREEEFRERDRPRLCKIRDLKLSAADCQSRSDFIA